MKRVILMCLSVIAAAGCALPTETDCTENATCGRPAITADASTDSAASGPDSAEGAAGFTGDGGQPGSDAVSDVAPDDGAADGVACDEGAAPAVARCVIRSERGVFVSPSGVDAATGASDAPVKTIQTALSKAKADGKRVYVCEGTYDELVTSDAQVDGLEIYGGIDCATLAYDATKRPVVARGWRASGMAAGLTITDLEIRSPDATAAGESSIAVIANGAKIALRRVKVVAGKGAAGQAGAPGAPGDDGQAATVQQQGLAAVCIAAPLTNPAGAWRDPSACGSQGGPGGDGKQGFNGNPGTPGVPDTDVYPPSVNNRGAEGVTGGDGSAGSLGNPGTPGVATSAVGMFTASGFTPAAAAGNGTDGFPGQGGGGGGASNAKGVCVGASGGAGGMGGCGGKFGAGGAGGGASIAVLIWQSTVSLDGCDLVSADGGTGGGGGLGGAGGTGKDGAVGGAAAAGGPGAGGKGGAGGNGGPGGSGAGGNGGPSYAVAHQGAAPALTGGITMTHGAGGAKGVGGGVGSSKAPDGAVGLAADTFAIP